MVSVNDDREDPARLAVSRPVRAELASIPLANSRTLAAQAR
jgi:hypothetical protein